MDLKKNLLVPEEVYSARVNDEHIPIVEKWFFEDINFFPDAVKKNKDFFSYCQRMGYAYMKNLNSKREKLYGNLNNIKTLGDENFTWKFNSAPLLNKKENYQFLCAGAGTNISFEIEMASQYPNSTLLLLDPSPQAITYVESLKLPPNIIFIKKGLAEKTGVLTFLKPNIKNIGSLSAKSINPGDEYYELEVTSLKDILNKFNISSIDYLKFDIEGCEHEVIRSFSSLENLPKQVAFEFDQPVPIWTCEKTILYLFSLGYEMISVWGLNILFQLVE